MTNGARAGGCAGSNYPFLTLKERDNETKLDYFLARYYSSTAGRFASADPLYLELRRLSDPQQLNLYAYCRNNPLRYSDPTGLDITITGTDADKLKDDFNSRKKAQFKIKLDSNGVAQVVDRDKIKVEKLSKSERALFEAITDPDRHAIIEGTERNDRIEMGAFGPDLGTPAGTNVIDTSDMALLRRVNKKLAGESISHEMLEAYESAKTGSTTWKPNHAAASQFYPEPAFTEFSSLPGEKSAPVKTGYTAVWTWQGIGSVKVTYQFHTPQPIPSYMTRQPAADMIKIEKKK